MDGDDYTIKLYGDVLDSQIINLCEEDFHITGSVINSDVISSSKGVVGKDNLKNASFKGKNLISVPCNEELKIDGDVTESAIVHGKLEIDKKPKLDELLGNVLDDLDEIDKLLN